MTINIYPAGPDDAYAMSEAGFAAFENDVLSNAQYQLKTAPPERLEEYRKYRIALTHLRMEGKGKYWFKAVDDSNGRLVGYTGLYSPEAEPVPFWTLPRPEYGNLDVDNEVHEKLDKCKEKNIGDRKDIWC